MGRAKKEEVKQAVSGFAEHAGKGFENTDSDDFAIPFLRVLQAMSPQCKKSDGAYIKGAEEGMLFNTVTNELIDGEEGVDVVVAAYQKVQIEWRPEREGLEAIHPADVVIPTVRNDNNKDVMENGNELEMTRMFYVLLLDADGGINPAVISMSRTQTKYAKRWLSMAKEPVSDGAGGTFVPPLSMYVYHLTTVPETSKDFSWFSWHVEKGDALESPEQPVFIEAQEFDEKVQASAVKLIDAPQEQEAIEGKGQEY